jgi:hypothetical protein
VDGLAEVPDSAPREEGAPVREDAIHEIERRGEASGTESSGGLLGATRALLSGSGDQRRIRTGRRGLKVESWWFGKASHERSRVVEGKRLEFAEVVGIRARTAGKEIHAHHSFSNGPKPVAFGKPRLCKVGTGHHDSRLPVAFNGTVL